VKTTNAPQDVKLWQATNPDARDFRVKTIGRTWQSETLNGDNGAYIAKITPPKKGWTAYFVELTYDVGQSYPLKLTTGVRILPDVLPYADLDPAKAKLEGEPTDK
jgi:PhoPQ-activated pathogenicity-related protein